MVNVPVDFGSYPCPLVPSFMLLMLWAIFIVEFYPLSIAVHCI